MAHYPLIRREHFGEEEIIQARTKGVHYVIDADDTERPWRKDSRSELTKGLRWFAKVADPVFKTRKKIGKD